MLILKLLNSFKYAWYGIKQVFVEEQNFQIHCFSAVVVILMSIFKFNFSYIELAITLICIALVLVTEIVNTAIENSWDHLEPNHHPVVKSVKDMMAGAVMVVSIFSAVVFLPDVIKTLMNLATSGLLNFGSGKFSLAFLPEDQTPLEATQELAERPHRLLPFLPALFVRLDGLALSAALDLMVAPCRRHRWNPPR